MTTNDHAPRMNLAKAAPDVYKAMLALDSAAGTGLDPALTELVRIRASQINGCAYCLDMHTKDARARGESEQRIYLLNAWRESAAFYSEKEQAALALTEAVTLVSQTHVPDDVYAVASKHFPEAELAQLIGLILTINAWNRIAVTTRSQPGSYQPA
jgi:AhpD family alkylhydroperoxidase